MKLLFQRDEGQEVTVYAVDESGNKKGFSYLSMIKSLIEKQELKTPGIEGEFADAEKDSINSMVKHINELLVPKEKSKEQ